jgi:hypothetical protein
MNLLIDATNRIVTNSLEENTVSIDEEIIFEMELELKKREEQIRLQEEHLKEEELMLLTEEQNLDREDAQIQLALATLTIVHKPESPGWKRISPSLRGRACSK